MSSDHPVTRPASTHPQARPITRPAVVAGPERPGVSGLGHDLADLADLVEPGEGFPYASALLGLLGLLDDEPSVGMALVTTGARALSANRRFTGLTTASAEPGPPKSATEGHRGAPHRLGVWDRVGPQAVQMALEQRRPVVVRCIHEGRQVQCMVWPLPEGPGGDGLCLVLASEGLAEPMVPARRDPAAPAFAVLHPPMAELGPLSSLTGRELEVLAWIGQGMATREVAAALGRSPRTVERHCDAIHKKLGTTNRVQMARFALLAGLTPESARLKRV